MESGRSIVEYFGDHKGYRCGYCGSSDTNYSHGMWAHSMTVQDYQDLIDRGWRRSGKYCYKPTMKMTCCPHYTIKQDAPNFKISKSQKKVIKTVNRYLIHGIRRGDKHREGNDESDVTETPGSENVEHLEKIVPSDLKLKQGSQVKTKAAVHSKSESSSKGDNSVQDASSSGAEAVKPGQKKYQEGMETENKKSQPPKPGSGADPSKPACRKAKDLRKEKKLEKLAARGGDAQAAVESKKKETETKPLEDYLSEPEKASNVAHKLEIRLVRSAPQNALFVSTFKAAYTVYHVYQMIIHKDPPDKPTQKQYTRFLVDSPLQTRLVLVNPQSNEYRASFTDTHQVFKKYQMTIHKEPANECTKQDFTQFLSNSPLEPMTPEGGPQPGYGSFHQQYLLDGKLIAVGVIDILPHCVSSVYLYYDPDYSFLSLGTYTALREIAFVRELHKKTPDLRYYYMGYYIHSCPKMRYKGQYYPSYIACPEAFTWVPIEKCSPKLDVSRYARLEEEGIEDENGKIVLDRVLVLHDSEAMPYEVYRFLNPKANDDEEVMEYAKMAGKTCAERMLLFRK